MQAVTIFTQGEQPICAHRVSKSDTATHCLQHASADPLVVRGWVKDAVHSYHAAHLRGSNRNRKAQTAVGVASCSNGLPPCLIVMSIKHDRRGRGNFKPATIHDPKGKGGRKGKQGGREERQKQIRERGDKGRARGGRKKRTREEKKRGRKERTRGKEERKGKKATTRQKGGEGEEDEEDGQETS